MDLNYKKDQVTKVVLTMTLRELAVEYNRITGDNLARFRTLEIGRKKVLELWEKFNWEDPKPKPTVRRSSGNPATEHSRVCVTVDGTRSDILRSVGAAFRFFNLPMGRHITFRMQLKKSGMEIFEHDGKQYHFQIVRD